MFEGGNAINYMISQELKNAEFIIINTNAQDLEGSFAPQLSSFSSKIIILPLESRTKNNYQKTSIIYFSRYFPLNLSNQGSRYNTNHKQI